MVNPTLRNLFIVGALAVVFILVMKFAVNKLPFIPNGVKAAAHAV